MALDLASAVTTHLTADGLAPRTLNVLHEYRSSRLRAQVSRRGSAISRRIVMNNAG